MNQNVAIYSNTVTPNEVFTTPRGKRLISINIVVSGTAGTITYKNAMGDTQITYGFVGRNPIGAVEILSSGTTATGLYYEGTLQDESVAV